MVPIAAGVASAVAGAALIVLGFCLLKRKNDAKKGTTKDVHPPLATIDRGHDPITLGQNTAPPPPTYMYPVAARQENAAPQPPPYLHAVAIRQQSLEPSPPTYEDLVAPVASNVGVGGKRYL